MTYVVFPEEGHAFFAESNRCMLAVAEQFLAQCVGGAAEPIGYDLPCPTMTVPTGAQRIVGLEDALRHRPKP